MISYRKRLQVNVFLRRNLRISLLAKVKEVILPVVWIEEEGQACEIFYAVSYTYKVLFIYVLFLVASR